MEEQQEDETSTKAETEDTDEGLEIRASREAIDFMLNIGKRPTCYIDLFKACVVVGTRNAWELAPPGADTSRAA